MSYLALARKWRPRSFAELVGQEHVRQALGNALTQGRVHHAFLFTGTRGVGKTTIARILSKCLNCDTGVTATPCGICASCKEIDEGRFVDLIEVDAASRTKVDDTRELLENVQYSPTRGRYKVYLVDEVHMLSTHSFNALLKTLEEPPPHVKFLLATTDPQKLPVTVLSRCLQFNLKRLPVALISEHLNKVLTAEKISFDAPALRLVAQAADGSMRDALSLLDQLIAFGGGKVGEASARDMLGTIDRDHITKLARSLATGDAAQLIETARKLEEFSPDYGQVLDDLAALLTRLALQQLVPAYEGDELFDPAFVKELAATDFRRRRAALLPDRHSRPPRSAVRAGSAHRFRNDAGAHAGVSPGLGRGSDCRSRWRRCAGDTCRHEFRRSVASGRGHRASGFGRSHRSRAVVARHRRSRCQRRGSPARNQLRARGASRQHVAASRSIRRSRARRRRSKSLRRRWRNISADVCRSSSSTAQRRSRPRRKPASDDRRKRSTRRAANSKKIPRCAK